MKKILIIISIIFISLFGVNRLNALSVDTVNYGIAHEVYNGQSLTSHFISSPTHNASNRYDIASQTTHFNTTYQLNSFSLSLVNPMPKSGSSYNIKFNFTLTSTNLESVIPTANSLKSLSFSLYPEQGTFTSQNVTYTLKRTYGSYPIYYYDFEVISSGQLTSSNYISSIVFYMNNVGASRGLSFCTTTTPCPNNQTVWFTIMNMDMEVIMTEDPNTAIMGGINQNQQTIIDQNNQTNNKLDDLNNKQDQTNEKLDDLNNSIKDETPPDTSEFGNVASWLPPGPVDSIIMLPLNVLNAISNALNSDCTEVNLPLPFIDKELPLMCGTEFYSNITGLSFFLNTLFTILGFYTLYKYFVYLYNWIDGIISMKEREERWGAT